MLICPSGLGREVCADHIPISSHDCNTQIRHFTPAQLWDPFNFPHQLQPGITSPSKAPLPQDSLWEETQRRFLLTSAQAESNGWEGPATSLRTYLFCTSGWTGQTEGCWQSKEQLTESSCTGHCRSCNLTGWILVSSFRLVQESRGKQSSSLAATAPEENIVEIV